jgi:putative peptidoglycan lipid II flippase
VGLFVALIGGAIFTVLYPHISKLAAEGDIAKLKMTLTRSITYVTAIMLPICVGLVILAEPGVRIMFERGHFTAVDTTHTANILRMYAILALAGSISPLIIRAFYAVQNTKIPAYLSIVSVLASIGFSFLLIGPLGAEGLALAGSISAVLLTILLLIFFRKKMGNLELWSNLPEFIKIVLATVCMGIGVWFIADALALMDVSVIRSAAFCVFIAGWAAFVYFILLLLMGSKIAVDGVMWAVKFFERKQTSAQ